MCPPDTVIPHTSGPHTVIPHTSGMVCACLPATTPTLCPADCTQHVSKGHAVAGIRISDNSFLASQNIDHS